MNDTTDNIEAIINDPAYKKNIDSINDVYSSLFNSLGVEPGLLSKSSIGKKIETKYRDDSIDAKVESIIGYNNHQKTFITNENKNYNDKIIIDHYNPFNDQITTNKSNIDYEEITLDSVLKYYQLKNKLSDNQLIENLKKYIEERRNK